MKVLSVLVALAATVGILFLVSAPTGGGHGEGHGSEHTETEHVEETNTIPVITAILLMYLSLITDTNDYTMMEINLNTL